MTPSALQGRTSTRLVEDVRIGCSRRARRRLRPCAPWMPCERPGSGASVVRSPLRALPSSPPSTGCRSGPRRCPPCRRSYPRCAGGVVACCARALPMGERRRRGAEFCAITNAGALASEPERAGRRWRRPRSASWNARRWHRRASRPPRLWCCSAHGRHRQPDRPDHGDAADRAALRWRLTIRRRRGDPASPVASARARPKPRPHDGGPERRSTARAATLTRCAGRCTTRGCSKAQMTFTKEAGGRARCAVAFARFPRTPRCFRSRRASRWCDLPSGEEICCGSLGELCQRTSPSSA